jgi:DNA-binding transcriptional LysR family regulator
MISNNINLNHLRIFECVYRTRSMTTASEELHLTQSGVSQHIKAFEEVLGVRLFDRIKQRIVPTSAAAALFERCAGSLNGIEQALGELKGGDRQLSGTVRIGMPIEFGNNVVMPLLPRFGQKHPLVRFHLTLDFASVMNEKLLSGELDFAFIDEFAMDRRISIDKVYDEVLDLCVSTDALKRYGPPKHARKYFEALEYVEYQKDAPILRRWFEHHIGSRNLALNVKATVMDVQGVARLIMAGTWAGILPQHLVRKLPKEVNRSLHSFRGCGKPMKNAISVAYLRERSQSPAAQALLVHLKEAMA